ncbi:pseudouridine synthase [Xanthobacter sediminis]
MPRTSPPRKDKNNVPRLKRELPAAPRKEAERVAKVVARAGLASRREIEEWIAQGRVAVNGTVLTSPAVTVTAKDQITVDGAPLPEKERTRLFLYHKPRGVVTTNRDPEGRATLFEILPKGLPRLVSVGRLDLNSEGLLLLTNDGGLARVLELPETGWLRRYRVRANGDIDQAKLDTLLKGITVDGVEYGPIEAELDRVQGANAWITVSLREGKNREVRNVLGALGLQVNRLIRISYGPFQLGDTPECGIEEVRTRVLREQIGDELSAAAGADFDAPLVEREIEHAPDTAQRLAGRLSAERTERAAAKAHTARPAEGQVRDEFRTGGPRVRRRIAEEGEVESRGTVADRKGRAVKVERLAKAPGADERPTRSGPRSGGKDFGRPARGRRFEGDGGGERPRRFEGDRPQHGKGGFGGRAEGAPRSFRTRDGEGRDDARRDDRPGRAPGRGFGGAEGGKAPGRFRSEGGEGRGPRGGFGGRAEGERAPRSFRPREGEGRDERPAHGKAPGRFGAEGSEGRGPRGGFGGRAEGERAPRSFRSRDGEGRDEVRRGDRPAHGKAPGRFGAEGGEGRPRRENFGDRPERGERAPHGKSFSGKGSAGKGPVGKSPVGKGSPGKGFGEKSFGARPERAGGGDRQERRGPPKEGFKGAGRDGGRPGGAKGGKPFGKGGHPGGGRPSAPRGKR